MTEVRLRSFGIFVDGWELGLSWANWWVADQVDYWTIEIAEKVVLIDFIVVPERKVCVILNHLPEYIALTLAEPGCLAFTASHLADKPTIFDVYEEFDGAESFAARQARVQASRRGADTKNVERSYGVTGI